MRIRSFHAIRPPPARAAEVASLPYDVGELADARREALANPASFLHVERPEVDLPDGFDSATGLHHRTAAANLQRFLREGLLARDAEPALYVYELALGRHRQTGVLTTCHIDDYFQDVIKKHEKTKKPTEDDRTQHVLQVGAQTGPIFLIHRDDAEIDALVVRVRQGAPLYDFTAADGIRHTVWRLPQADELVRAFARIPVAYVADGHHRAAAAARAGQERRAANPNHRGNEEYNWFLAVLFPASHLQVLAYNRCLVDLNGLDAAAFLKEVRARFHVAEGAAARPAAPRHISMCLGGRWYGLTWEPDRAGRPGVGARCVGAAEPAAGAGPGIADPRNNSRIEYVGGFQSAEELQRRIADGRAAVAFSVYPTTVRELMAISDAGQIMPPKSTWFEPKLRSGLFVHALE
jgi:uncharacterized protein (DUF1015 family)